MNVRGDFLGPPHGTKDDRKLEQAETRARKKINKCSSTVQSDNVPDLGYSFIMPPDGPPPGTSYQFPVETSWGRGRAAFPICGERQSAATDNLKGQFVQNNVGKTLKCLGRGKTKSAITEIIDK